MMESNVGLQAETFWETRQKVHDEEDQTASQPPIISHSRCSRTEASQARWTTACLRTSWPIKRGGSHSRADLQNHPPQPAGHPQQQACPPGHSLFSLQADAAWELFLPTSHLSAHLWALNWTIYAPRATTACNKSSLSLSRRASSLYGQLIVKDQPSCFWGVSRPPSGVSADCGHHPPHHPEAASWLLLLGGVDHHRSQNRSLRGPSDSLALNSWANEGRWRRCGPPLKSLLDYWKVRGLELLDQWVYKAVSEILIWIRNLIWDYLKSTCFYWGNWGVRWKLLSGESNLENGSVMLQVVQSKNIMANVLSKDYFLHWPTNTFRQYFSWTFWLGSFGFKLVSLFFMMKLLWFIWKKA